MKPIEFRGSALDDLRQFPDTARRQTGFQLDQVQRGRHPDDWKPMSSVGQGVIEIRIRDESGAFRVLYLAKFERAIYVLHCFQKKTQKTSKADVDLARSIEGTQPMTKKRFTSVWDAIEDTPAEAANMKLRSELMLALRDRIAGMKFNQSEAAKLFGVTQPRVSDLMRGKIELFGIDTLVNMAVAAGLKVEVRVSEAA